MNQAVFVDRDNTLIANDDDLGDPDQVKLIQGAASALASLRGLGYKIVVVSNQGGVARGVMSEADVEQVNQRTADLVKQTSGATIDRFYYCPYHPEGTVEKYRREHPWRKPQPGMLQQASRDLNLDLSRCWMVGDAARDVEAGRAAGVSTVLVQDTPTEPHKAPGRPDFVVGSLVAAARIVAQQNPRESPSDSDDAAHREPITAHTSAQTPPSPGADRDASAPPVAQPQSTERPITQVLQRASAPFKPWTIQASDDTDAESPAPAEPRPAAASPRRAAQPPPPPASNQRIEELLDQILVQLKGRRADEGDFSFSKLLAGVFQVFALTAALMAVLNLSDTQTLLGWMGGAILFQLAVISLLILHWQR